MFEIIVVLLLIYIIWSTESNAKTIYQKQNEIAKEIELLKSEKPKEFTQQTKEGEV